MAMLQIVRFTSGLSEAEVRQKYEDRAALFRAVPGLLQKYYVKYPGGEHGAVYIWEDESSYEAYRTGPESGSIATAYAVEGEVKIELAELVMSLR